MDSSPLSSETPPITRGRRRVFLRFSILFAVIILVVVALFCLPSSQPQFTWLTPAQAAQASRPGLLLRLKYALNRFAGPLMRHFPSHRPNIMITMHILEQPAKLGQVVPDVPGITSPDGQSAWILSHDQLFSFQQRLKADRDVSTLSSPRILTSSGGQARFMTGQSVPLISTNLGVITSISTNFGLTMDVTATASGDSINIVLIASDTGLAGPPITPSSPIVTNFSAICSARLANGDGLVISSGKIVPKAATNYWLIISPMLVDATGKPIKK